jgi:hypothetical protein
MSSSDIPTDISTTGWSAPSTICWLLPSRRRRLYLSQPRVVFEFADPQLESLSAGQKVLVRMGADNERRIKAKLRELRKVLASGEVHR